VTTTVVKVGDGADVGSTLQRSIPPEFFSKRPIRFATKFWFAVALIAAGYTAILLLESWPITVGAIVIIGLMYAHLVELQHEALHGHAFRSRPMNRLYGFACGLFMLSSYFHYQYEHLRHHASLGQPDNQEFFSYRLRNLDNVAGFLVATFYPGRYVDVFRDIMRSMINAPIPGVKRERDRKRIAKEYRLFGALVLGAVAFTVLTGDLFFVFAWLIPLIAVAEPIHFLIELPEHFGLNTQSDSNVLSNTRTIKTSRLMQWFTNFNNLHTAHHYHQGVPMANAGRLDELVMDAYEQIEPSYLCFYRKVLRGQIRHSDPTEELV
jgi:fatty acid desaturase